VSNVPKGQHHTPRPHLQHFIDMGAGNRVWTYDKLSGDPFYSVMIRSAHSTSDTKIVGFPNFAPH
jgi:hypothetical protein